MQCIFIVDSVQFLYCRLTHYHLLPLFSSALTYIYWSLIIFSLDSISINSAHHQFYLVCQYNNLGYFHCWHCCMLWFPNTLYVNMDLSLCNASNVSFLAYFIPVIKKNGQRLVTKYKFTLNIQELSRASL